MKKALNQRVVLSTIRLVPSKKNRVWIAETDVRPVVVKRFLTGKCGVEFESLLVSREKGVPVPFPLWKQGDHLVMEYISGENCESLVNDMFSADAAEGIGSWLASYHRLGGGQLPRIMGDAVLSNFIMSDGRIFGVDLEDSTFGDPMDDLGQILASVLSSEPFFTPIKFDLCLRLVNSYDRSASAESRERVRPYVSKFLRSGAKSRPLFRRTFVAAAKSLEKGWPELV